MTTQKCWTCERNFDDGDVKEVEFHTERVYSCKISATEPCAHCRGFPCCLDCPDDYHHCKHHRGDKRVKINMSARGQPCENCRNPYDRKDLTWEEEHKKPLFDPGQFGCCVMCKDQPRCFICPDGFCHCKYHKYRT